MYTSKKLKINFTFNFINKIPFSQTNSIFWFSFNFFENVLPVRYPKFFSSFKCIFYNLTVFFNFNFVFMIIIMIIMIIIIIIIIFYHYHQYHNYHHYHHYFVHFALLIEVFILLFHLLVFLFCFHLLVFLFCFHFLCL